MGWFTVTSNSFKDGDYLPNDFFPVPNSCADSGDRCAAHDPC